MKKGLNNERAQQSLFDAVYAAPPQSSPALLPVKKPAVTSTIKKTNNGAYEDIDIKKLIQKQNALMRRAHRAAPALYNPAFTYSGNPTRQENIKSFFADPLALETNYYGGNIKTISPFYGRKISYQTLRRVSEKAWIINLCIQNLSKKIFFTSSGKTRKPTEIV